MSSTKTIPIDDLEHKIADTAVVSKNCELGFKVTIWNFCNLYDCTIGYSTSIGSYTEIGKGVKIGNECRIQARVFIPQGVRIGNKVFVGPGVIFTNDKRPSLGAEFVPNATYVEDEVVIGAGAIILPKITIGKGAMIGAGAVVTKDVPPYTEVYGNPAETH